MNYEAILLDCERRMEIANDMTAVNAEMSRDLWWSAYKRWCAALSAKWQASQLHYTNCGSVGLRLPR